MKTFGFQWHLLDKCNLRCKHCYQEGFEREADLETLIEMANRVVGTLSDRVISINLTGGEPFLLSGLLRLVEHLHRFSNVNDISIITNGTLVDRRILEGLARYPLLSTFKISLESSDPALNDSIRGRGNLRRVLDNIDAFRGTGKDVMLMMTLSERTVEGIAEMVELAYDVNASGVIFERFVPLGRGRGMADAVLSPQRWSQAVADISLAAGLEIDPSDLAPYKAFMLLFDSSDEPLKGALCNLGDESMALMPDGTVYPCRRLPIPVGNVLQEPFPDILSRLARYSPQRIRPWLSGSGCGRCAEKECAGCRALAWAVTGDFLADDFQCPKLVGSASADY